VIYNKSRGNTQRHDHYVRGLAAVVLEVCRGLDDFLLSEARAAVIHAQLDRLLALPTWQRIPGDEGVLSVSLKNLRFLYLAPQQNLWMKLHDFGAFQRFFDTEFPMKVEHPAQIWNNGNCKKLRIPEEEQDASRNRTQPGPEIQVLRL